MTGLHKTPQSSSSSNTVKIEVPQALGDLKEAYLAEPLQRQSEVMQPLAEALTDFFAQLLPSTSRSSLFTMTKFCLMELALIKLTQAASGEGKGEAKDERDYKDQRDPIDRSNTDRKHQTRPKRRSRN